MAKISRSNVEGFLRAPDAGVRVVLIYGPDQGLVDERTSQLARAIADDLNDPFQVSRFDAAELKSDPSRLIDAALALVMTGGRRLVLVRAATDDISGALELVLEAEHGADGLVIVAAGDLSPRSPVRRLCEKSNVSAVIACYGDDASTLSGLIHAVTTKYQLVIERDAEAYLLQRLGADRAASRSELEKLALYVGENATVHLPDVIAAVGDGGALSIDKIVHATAGGNIADLDRELSRAFAEGTQPIAVLRAAMRHFQRLHQVASLADAGESRDIAIKSLRPPVLFLYIRQFKTALDRWPVSRIGDALQLLTDAELECKSTGIPADAVCGRALLQLARGARRPSAAR